jgi:outer membrane usher protein
MKRSHSRQSQAPTLQPAGWFVLNPVTAVVVSAFAAIGCAGSAHADAAEPAESNGAVAFDTTFLQVDPGARVDVARFARGNVVSPGAYTVDIWINDNRVAHDSARFVAAHDGDSARVPVAQDAGRIGYRLREDRGERAAGRGAASSRRMR